MLKIRGSKSCSRGFLGADRSDRSSRVQAPDRSDRSVAPVRPVLADQFCGFSRIASDLLRGFARSFEAFCVGLAFPYLFQTLVRTLEGLGDFRDIGRQFEFRRNFDRLSFTPPLVAGFGPSIGIRARLRFSVP